MALEQKINCGQDFEPSLVFDPNSSGTDFIGYHDEQGLKVLLYMITT